MKSRLPSSVSGPYHNDAVVPHCMPKMTRHWAYRTASQTVNQTARQRDLASLINRLYFCRFWSQIPQTLLKRILLFDLVNKDYKQLLRSDKKHKGWSHNLLCLRFFISPSLSRLLISCSSHSLFFSPPTMRTTDNFIGFGTGAGANLLIRFAIKVRNGRSLHQIRRIVWLSSILDVRALYSICLPFLLDYL